MYCSIFKTYYFKFILILLFRVKGSLFTSLFLLFDLFRICFQLFVPTVFFLRLLYKLLYFPYCTPSVTPNVSSNFAVIWSIFNLLMAFSGNNISVYTWSALLTSYHGYFFSVQRECPCCESTSDWNGWTGSKEASFHHGGYKQTRCVTEKVILLFGGIFHGITWNQAKFLGQSEEMQTPRWADRNAKQMIRAAGANRGKIACEQITIDDSFALRMWRETFKRSNSIYPNSQRNYFKQSSGNCQTVLSRRPCKLC